MPREQICSCEWAGHTTADADFFRANQYKIRYMLVFLKFRTPSLVRDFGLSIFVEITHGETMY
jgi:hypothetical protein